MQIIVTTIVQKEKLKKEFLAVCKDDTCNARIITNANLEEGVSVVKPGQYEYKATQAKIEVRRTVARIKRRVPIQITNIYHSRKGL